MDIESIKQLNYILLRRLKDLTPNNLPTDSEYYDCNLENLIKPQQERRVVAMHVTSQQEQGLACLGWSSDSDHTIPVNYTLSSLHLKLLQ